MNDTNTSTTDDKDLSPQAAPEAAAEDADTTDAQGETDTPDTPGAPAAAAESDNKDAPAGESVEYTGADELAEDEPLITPGMNWFVLRVASNKEDSVKETLLRKIKIEGMTHLVNRILVPTEKVKSIKGGKQKIQLKKLYPGYVFVEMKLENDGRIPQDVFFLIKETTGVGDFIGTAGRPSPMSLPEIEKIQLASKPPEETPAEVKMEFAKGDHVRIIEGPFANTEGNVDEVFPDQGKVRVIVTIFGRATPVDMEYWNVEKAEEE